MRTAFLGTPEFAVSSLEIFKTLDFIEIGSVITHPDKPKGRHLVLSSPPIKVSAEKLNLPIFQPDKVSSPDFVRKLADMNLDLIIVVSFGEILSEEVLKIPRLGCINLHASLLPKYRGASPVSRAIMDGEKKTGVTTFWLSKKMDSGDIILQKETDILPEDTRSTLENRLSKIGAELLKDTLIKIKDGTAPRIPQDEFKATYAPKIKKEDGLINWKDTALKIHNQARAMNPWPIAYTYIKGTRVEIWDTEIMPSECIEKPGIIALLDEKGIGISTGKDILLIKELQAEGKKRIRAVDFIHGYRLNEGQEL